MNYPIETLPDDHKYSLIATSLDDLPEFSESLGICLQTEHACSFLNFYMQEIRVYRPIQEVLGRSGLLLARGSYTSGTYINAYGVQKNFLYIPIIRVQENDRSRYAITRDIQVALSNIDERAELEQYLDDPISAQNLDN